MGENFPEGTSQSDPSAVPRQDDDPRSREDEDKAIGEVGRDEPSTETEAEEAPESQQAG
jgi:hypothetical protein